MVATLVVALPAAGAGGALVVRHQDRETVIDMHTDEPSELAYAAFYADCPHEIRPVAGGHRICLVYNLLLREAALDAGPIRDLFRSAWCFGLQDELQHAAVFLAGHPKIASPDHAVPHALEQLWTLDQDHAGGSPAVAALWHHAAEHLLARSERPPEAPRTWVLPVRIDCECEHCTELQTFCDDPIATEHQFAVRQELRAHLRLKIKRHRMDLRCRELKRGRPYRLVCIKTRASHERRLERYGKEVEAMRRLVTTAPGVPSETGLAKRLQAAIARSG